jgi:hypothetical protein
MGEGVLALGGFGGVPLTWSLVVEVSIARASIVGTAPTCLQQVQLAERLLQVWRSGRLRDRLREQNRVERSRPEYANLGSRYLFTRRDWDKTREQAGDLENLPVIDQWTAAIQDAQNSILATNSTRLSLQSAYAYAEAGVACGRRVISGGDFEIANATSVNSIVMWLTDQWPGAPADEPGPDTIAKWWLAIRMGPSTDWYPYIRACSVLRTIGLAFVPGYADAEARIEMHRKEQAAREAAAAARAFAAAADSWDGRAVLQASGGYPERPSLRPFNWDLGYPPGTWAPGTGPKY